YSMRGRGASTYSGSISVQKLLRLGTILYMDDGKRHRALRDWVLQHETIRGLAANLPSSYEPLRDYLLQRGLVHFHELPRSETEPFAMGTDFYGESFEDAVDALPEPG